LVVPSARLRRTVALTLTRVRELAVVGGEVWSRGPPVVSVHLRIVPTEPQVLA
jgi:hypothetical protein